MLRIAIELSLCLSINSGLIYVTDKFVNLENFVQHLQKSVVHLVHRNSDSIPIPNECVPILVAKINLEHKFSWNM